MKVLIIGGCGFIGTNAAKYFAEKGDTVVLFDNLSRTGVDENKNWITQLFPRVSFVRGDIRNFLECKALFAENRDASLIIHLAGQVAVTTSVIDPKSDFENNALGTLNVLENVRLQCPNAFFIYSSTNKVYGKLDSADILEEETRYLLKSYPNGISEDCQLDFYSPYGCSKGSADQYVRDYARIYGLKTVVFRQSCIYGFRQFGVEDQGWLVWFLVSALAKKTITIYGDGKQVRDVLFIDDLVLLYDLAFQNAAQTAGKIYNAGGGPDNALSLLELIALLQQLTRDPISLEFSDWRPGDQKVYISDVRKLENEIGWRPNIPVETGVEKLFSWTKDNQQMIFHKLGLNDGLLSHTRF